MTLKVLGVPAAQVKDRVGSAGGVKKVNIVQEMDSVAWVRVYPQSKIMNGNLAREVALVAGREGWKVEELHTEEGRLDEVFRRITMPDTAAGSSRQQQS